MRRASPPPYKEHGQGYHDASISYQESEKLGSVNSGISAWLDATSHHLYMDHQNTVEDERRQQVRARSQNRLSEPYFDTTRQAVDARSSPQRQWQEVPISYRPREWHDCSEERLPLGTSTPPHVPSFRHFQRHLAQPVQPLRPRRRPEALTSTPSLQQFELHASDVNPALLYPQLSPYSGESTCSAPDEPQYYLRSVSQPNTPSFLAYRGHDEPNELDISLTEVPVMSNSHPARVAAQHGTAVTAEAPFTDDEEFHLFVQATAGLGPEQPLRGSPTIPAPYQFDRRPGTTHGRRREDPLPVVSPIQQQTPTTIRALQDMAQLPQPAFILPRRPNPQRLVTEPIHASDGGLDLWLEPPTAGVNEGSDVSPVEEDELPGYAESQAQAQAVQATEARRRAQELARRWQQAHQ